LLIAINKLPESDPGRFVAHLWRCRLKNPATFERTLADSLDKCRQICEADKPKREHRKSVDELPEGFSPISERHNFICSELFFYKRHNLVGVRLCRSINVALHSINVDHRINLLRGLRMLDRKRRQTECLANLLPRPQPIFLWR
jgi:hypothetical protein